MPPRVMAFKASSASAPPKRLPIPEPRAGPKNPGAMAKPIVPPIIGAAFFKIFVKLFKYSHLRYRYSYSP